MQKGDYDAALDLANDYIEIHCNVHSAIKNSLMRKVEQHKEVMTHFGTLLDSVERKFSVYKEYLDTVTHLGKHKELLPLENLSSSMYSMTFRNWRLLVSMKL